MEACRAAAIFDPASPTEVRRGAGSFRLDLANDPPNFGVGGLEKHFAVEGFEPAQQFVQQHSK